MDIYFNLRKSLSLLIQSQYSEQLAEAQPNLELTGLGEVI